MRILKKEIIIPVGKHVKLHGNLNIPSGSNTLVIFSHGSGSSRFSPRNNYVADVLNKQNISTLLADLMTDEEDSVYENRFDIDLLTDRLIEITNYVLQLPDLKDFATGYFGASTGAASALQASSRLNDTISAVVSRGGRPDLAEEHALHLVTAPTLLIIGSLDSDVIELNKYAFSILRCERRMEIVEGASHLFEEPGKLEIVAELACNWFKKNLHTQKSTVLND